jgi:hypothetical protein
MNRKSLQLALALMVIAAGLIGCPQRKSIADVLANPAKFYDDDVAVTGTVTESWGVMGVGAFQIDDGTGKLWIIPNNRGVPPKGARVGSSGRVQSGFSLGGKNFAVVMREKDRRD